MITPSEQLMRIAITEAQRSKAHGDLAIGALIARGATVIARSGNRMKLDHDPTAHAEMVAIRQAAQVVGSRHLIGCILYTTHEPCPMCTAAAMWARLRGIVFGCRIDDMISFNRKYGNRENSWRTIYFSAAQINDKGNPRLDIVEAFLRNDCRELFHAA